MVGTTCGASEIYFCTEQSSECHRKKKMYLNMLGSGFDLAEGSFVPTNVQ